MYLGGMGGTGKSQALKPSFIFLNREMSLIDLLYLDQQDHQLLF